jgi:PAS domain S-box-containing protein
MAAAVDRRPPNYDVPLAFALLRAGGDGYRVLEVNAVFERLTEVPRQAAVGAELFELLPDLPATEWRAVLAEVRASGRPCQFDGRSTRLGTLLEAYAFRARGDELALLLLDAGLKRQKVQTLIDGDQRYRRLFEISPDAVFIAGRDGAIVSCNDEAPRLLGLASKDDLLGRDAFALFAPGEAAGRAALLERGAALRGREQRLSLPGGRALDIELSIAALPDAAGVPSAVIGVARDITERKRGEEALRESEERYRMLLAMSPDAVYISEQGAIVEANAAAAALFGVADAGELRGRRLREFAHPDSRALLEQRSETLYGGEAEAPLVEEKLVRPDGGVIHVEVKSRSFRHRGRLLVQTIARDVTGRKRTEGELRRFKHQLEYVLDATRTAVAVIGDDYEIKYISPSWERVYGPVDGRPCHRYFERRDEPCDPCRIRDAIRGGKPVVLEESFAPDPRRAVQVHIVPFQDEAGAWMAAEFTVDVTELKRAGSAVRTLAQQWQTTFDAINDGIALLDPAGSVLRCNAALGTLLARACGDIVGRPCCSLLPGLDGDRGGEFMENLRRQRRRIGRELRDGERRLSLTFDPILGDGGALDGSVFILKDVTEVRRAEERTALMVEAVEQMEEGVMIYDTSDHLIYANPALERITGFSREELMGRNNAVPQQMLTREFGEFWKRVWERVAVDGVWHGSKSSMRKDGTAYEQELVASVVKNQRDEPISYLVVVRDVTETRRLQSIAEVATTMNNIGFIFSGVRHELGNPVNAIKMTTSILRQGYEGLDDATRLEYIDRVVADVGRLEALLKVLHSFSMFENLSLEMVELAGFFRDLMPTIEPDFKRASIAFRYDFPAGGCWVLADRRALYQVVVNLMTNAFAALEGRDRPAIAIRALPGGDRHRLVIEDNGRGMSDEVRRNAFKPFYTTKAGGTGLGMVICQKLVMAMDGQLEVDSRAGDGTSVAVVLPAAAPPEGAP